MIISDFLNSKNTKRYVYKDYDKYLLYVEEIDPGLAKVEREFIDYCNNNGIDYSIECDEGNEKSYTVKFSTKSDDLRDYITDFIKNNNIQVIMRLDKSRKYDILFNLTVRSIMDDLKIPDVDLMADDAPLNDRLESRLSEEILGMKSPHILMTVGAPQETAIEPDDNVTSQTKTWSFTGRSSDINKLKSVVDAIQSNNLSQVSGIQFDGVIRAECSEVAPDASGSIEASETPDAPIAHGMEEVLKFMSDIPNMMETGNETISQ